MNRKILILSILMCSIPLAGWAQKGKYGKLISWTLSNDTLFISGPGKMPDCNPHMAQITPPWFTEKLYTEISDKGYKAVSKGLNFTTVVISDSVTNIGDMAFAGCDSLTSVIIPEGVTRIGNMAFVSCSNLISITIPKTVTEIGYNAFGDNVKLNKITIEASTPPEFNITTMNDKPIYPFNGENNVLYVPKGKALSYKKAGWDKFFKKIVEDK